MAVDPISKLSSRQRECLRLALVRHGSKEIARELGISAHVVDKHIKAALKTLGVANRFEAARLLAAHEGPVFEGGEGVQRLAPQSSDLSEPPQSPPMQPQRLPVGERGTGAGFPLPFPSRGRPLNDLTALQRLGWIIAIAAVVAVLTAGLASGSVTLLEAVSGLI